MISGPKYNFSVGQKYFFVISKKVNIFHRIEPNYYGQSGDPVIEAGGLGDGGEVKIRKCQKVSESTNLLKIQWGFVDNLFVYTLTA